MFIPTLRYINGLVADRGVEVNENVGTGSFGETALGMAGFDGEAALIQLCSMNTLLVLRQGEYILLQLLNIFGEKTHDLDPHCFIGRG